MRSLRSLSECCKLITDGTHYTPPPVADGIPFLTVKDMTDKGLDILGSSRMTHDEFERAIAGNSAPLQGDVLFSKDGTVGKVHVVRDEGKFAVLSSIAILRPDPSTVDSEFLGYMLRHKSVLHDALNKKTGSAIRRLVLRDLKSVKIPVPSLLEQRRIVDLLSRAEGIVRLRQEAEKKAAELIPALFLDMFGDPATNPKGWPTKKLDQLCDLVRGSSPRPQGDPNYFGGPVPRLMIADITRDGVYVTPTIDSLTIEGAKKSRPMKTGEVVMAVSGAVGLPAILAVDACIHDGFVGFRSLDGAVSPEFLYNYLASFRCHSIGQAVGATFQNLKTDQVREWVVPIPPPGLQSRFQKTANDLRSLEAQQVAATTKARATFDALLARTFA